MGKTTGLTIEQVTAKILWALTALRLAQESLEIEDFVQHLTNQDLDKLENLVQGTLREICPDIIPIWEEAEAQAGALVTKALLILNGDEQTEREAIGYTLKRLMETCLKVVLGFSELFDREAISIMESLLFKLEGDPQVLPRVNNLFVWVARNPNKQTAKPNWN